MDGSFSFVDAEHDVCAFAHDAKNVARSAVHVRDVVFACFFVSRPSHWLYGDLIMHGVSHGESACLLPIYEGPDVTSGVLHDLADDCTSQRVLVSCLLDVLDEFALDDIRCLVSSIYYSEAEHAADREVPRRHFRQTGL